MWSILKTTWNRKVTAWLALLWVAFVVTASPAAAVHYACNCWGSDWICTIENENHEVIGYIFQQNQC